MTYYDKLWHIMTYHDTSWYIMTFLLNESWHIMTFRHKNKTIIFVVTIYDYALIDSFWGSAGFIDSPTSYATLTCRKLYWLRNKVSDSMVDMLTRVFWLWYEHCHMKKEKIGPETPSLFVKWIDFARRYSLWMCLDVYLLHWISHEPE